MPPSETGEFQTVSAVLDKRLVRKLNVIRRHQAAQVPHRHISMSDVIRETLAAGLATVAEREGVDLAELEAAEAEGVA